MPEKKRQCKHPTHDACIKLLKSILSASGGQGLRPVHPDNASGGQRTPLDRGTPSSTRRKGDDASTATLDAKTASGGQDLRPCTRAIASGGQRILRWTEGTLE